MLWSALSLRIKRCTSGKYTERSGALIVTETGSNPARRAALSVRPVRAMSTPKAVVRTVPVIPANSIGVSKWTALYPAIRPMRLAVVANARYVGGPGGGAGDDAIADGPNVGDVSAQVAIDDQGTVVRFLK